MRRTRDGALVVHHDAEIEGVGAIAELECRDLPARVASLADAMNACAGLEVNVEIKNHPSEAVYDASGALAHQVVDTLGDLGWLDSVIISCFDLATCEAVRRVDAAVKVGWLLDWRLDPGPSVAQVAERGLDAVHPFFSRIDAAFVQSAHERGIAVNVWTVNPPDEMRRMIAQTTGP